VLQGLILVLPAPDHYPVKIYGRNKYQRIYVTFGSDDG